MLHGINNGQGTNEVPKLPSQGKSFTKSLIVNLVKTYLSYLTISHSICQSKHLKPCPIIFKMPFHICTIS
jgi:hypothetical protein